MYPSIATITELRKELSQIQSRIDHLQNAVTQAELGVPPKLVCYPVHPASIITERGSLMSIGDTSPRHEAKEKIIDLPKFAKAVEHLCSGIVD